jgi:hypothetical protein
MAYQLAQYDSLNPMDIKIKMVNNINKLSTSKTEYLVSNMTTLIDKSLNKGETIDDKNTQKEFISFLLSLFS